MNILLSAGPTVEPLDAVRFLSNRSSGRMGVAIATQAKETGHGVRVVHGPLSVPYTPDQDWHSVETAVEMLECLKKHMSWCDVLIMSAAVCDFRPVQSVEGKQNKESMGSIQLVQNPDIAKSLAEEFSRKHIVVFSLENSLSPERPLKKMRAKSADWVIYNQLQSMGADISRFGILNKEGETILALSEYSKSELAENLIRKLEASV
ncbi:MAG: phosphopantothenoylcysteine decarboxylase [Planctomycetes bacterium]|nr:phosphopantothenoylcysteine decarboxylase [Planctomycetota bacterium]